VRSSFPPSVPRALLWFDGPLAALAASSAVALGVAWNQQSARLAVLWLWCGLALYALLSRISCRRGAWRTVAGLSVAAGTAFALYVVFQFSHLGYDVKVPALSRIGESLGSLLPRFGGWAPMSNSVATVLEGLVPLAAALAIRRTETWRRVAAGAGGVVMLSAIVLVASRGSWVALCAGTAAWALASAAETRSGFTSKVVAFACAVVVLLVVAAATHPVTQAHGGYQLGEIFDRPDRLHVYRNSLVLIQGFPFTGIGPGDQFAMALSRYALLIQVPFLTYAHNLYLSIWLEYGLAGILSWIVLVGSVIAAIVAGERAELGTRFRGAWVGVLVVLVHGLTDARQSVDRWTALPLFILLGLLAAATKRGRLPATAAAATVPAVAGLAFLALASPYLRPIDATWQANQGMLAEARAELAGLAPDDRKQALTQAQWYFERALRLDPRQPTAHQRLGILAIDGGRFNEARDHLEVAWRTDPGNPATRKALGLAYTWTGQLEQAKDLLTPVDSIVEELDVWSWHWERQRRLPQAANAARLSLMMRPARPEIERRLMDLEGRQAP
jgi:hypothetical protein